MPRPWVPCGIGSGLRSQRSNANAQRGLNEQPAESPTGRHRTRNLHHPLFFVRRNVGIAPINAWRVQRILHTACPARFRRSARSITATRSEVFAITPISWVTSMNAVP